MRTLRLLWLLPSLMLVWLVCMGTLCPGGGVTPSDCDPPAFVTTSLPAGKVGVSYEENIIDYTNEDTITPEVTVTAGTLPPGLSLSVDADDDDISFVGTPTTAGTYTFTLDLVDNCGLDSQAFTLVIDPPCPALSFGSTSLPQGAVGVEYEAEFNIVGGEGEILVTLVSGILPPGLSKAFTSLVGTPTTAGSFTFTVEASDTCSTTPNVTQEFTVVINPAGTCPPLVLEADPFPNGEVDVAYDQALQFTGGIADFSATVSAGALPTGLSLTANERLTGTPTAAGTFTFTIQLADSCTPPQVVEQAYTIEITEGATCGDELYFPPISSLPAGEVNVAYPEPVLLVLFGVPPLNFTISSGQLPDGLFLVESTGEIVGTPTGPTGTFLFEVTVTDSCDPPRSASQNGSIQITDGGGSGCEPLSLNPLPLEEGTVGTPYEHFFGEWTNGGEGDLSFFSQAPSDPPPGLTLDQDTGLLSGTPTTAGVHQFVLLVTDQCDPQQQAFHLITITIN